MPGVRDIKRRIRSVNNTKKITKAMEMVYAAKLRRTQSAVIASRPYAAKMEAVLGRIVASTTEKVHPFMLRRPVKKVGFIMITGDRGLAGGYNANLIRKTMVESARFDEAEKGFIAVGRKGRDYLRRRQRTLICEFIGINDIPKVSEAKTIVDVAVQTYLDETYDEIYLVYQEFVSALTQRPVIKQLLPIPYEEGEDASVSDYLYEPAPAQVLEMLLPKYILNKVYQGLMEAKASEHAARMTAMGSATKNADEMIGKLVLSFNRARQAAITREITEIVSGADALKAQ
ncbi:MAG: ATP synthase F1 subunit gamma [Clostridia bacterium]|jgi:F-type H+-transporting ATPase subunit gamma|nr:ATP synthase F1 subunit gamma [Clostridia bacterium]